MEKIIIMGSGGHSRSVVDTIKRAGIYTPAGFVDRKEHWEYEYRGIKVLGDDDSLEKLFKMGITHAFLGMANIENNHIRKRLHRSLEKAGFKIPAIIDPSAVVAEDVLIGEGAFIGKNVVVNAGAKIGRMCIVNTGAILEHDCSVGEFTHISVGTILCGQVAVGEDTFVGAGSTIIQGVTVNAHSVIGAGSLVMGDVKPGTRAFGLIRGDCH